MNIYIENLDRAIDDERLKEIFSFYGEVKSAEVVKDAFTDLSRGFGYVEMEEEAARNAVNGLNQTLLNELKLTVKEAAPKIERKGSYKVGTGAVNVYRFRKNWFFVVLIHQYMSNAINEMQIEFHDKANARFISVNSGFDTAVSNVSRRNQEFQFQELKKQYATLLEQELQMIAKDILVKYRNEKQVNEMDQIFHHFIKAYLHRFVQKVNDL
jgi:RNA recognition motif-containing protein